MKRNTLILLSSLIFSFHLNAQVTVSTYAGSGAQGYSNGAAASSQFYWPYGVDADAAGNIYVVDAFNHVIRKITPAGIVSTVAGTGVAGYLDGSATVAQFNTPTGLAVDAIGNVYVCDNANNRIRMIDPLGNVTTVAGTGSQGALNGSATSATFYEPKEICLSPNGDIYVADYENHRIRKISNGMVTTFAGSSAGYANGNGTSAQFYRPRDLCMDATGNLYVTDLMNHRIRKIDPNGNVTTFAGSGVQGTADGSANIAQFSIPTGIDIDNGGNLYVIDAIGSKIRRVDTGGNVTTIAGSGSTGFNDGSPSTAMFDLPQGLCLDAAGDIYIGDRNNNRIRKINLQANGIKDIKNEILFSCYPNPSNSTITITFDPTIKAEQLEMIDQLGRIINKEKLSTGIGSHSVDVSSLTQGVYFIRITGGNKYGVSPVIIY